jgi:hypothetical protein
MNRLLNLFCYYTITILENSVINSIVRDKLWKRILREEKAVGYLWEVSL